MKHQSSFTFFLFVQILVSLLTGMITPSLGAVDYPVCTQKLRDQITAWGEQGKRIHGEYVDSMSGDAIVIDVPGSPNGGYVFEINFIDVIGLPGYRKPSLSSYGGIIGISPLNEISYWEYPNGQREYTGSNNSLGIKVYFYAWSWFDEFYFEHWSCDVTYGVGASVDEPGAVISRAQFCTIPGEPKEIGFMITDNALQGDQMVMAILFDSQADFKLEMSSDLRIWQRNYAQPEIVEEAEFEYGGVTFRQALLRPITPPGGLGPRKFFRLSKN